MASSYKNFISVSSKKRLRKELLYQVITDDFCEVLQDLGIVTEDDALRIRVAFTNLINGNRSISSGDPGKPPLPNVSI